MKCKEEFEYIMLLINDYLNTLPASSKVAVAPQAQRCANEIVAVLQGVASMPAAPNLGDVANTPAVPTAAPTS